LLLFLPVRPASFAHAEHKPPGLRSGIITRHGRSTSPRQSFRAAYGCQSIGPNGVSMNVLDVHDRDKP
jgi:hypothetical protein